MFKNKHLIAALLIAPILSIISYFAVDYVVKEKPHKAKQGMAYELIPKSNCRYQSGICEMKNGDFEIAITANRLQNGDIQMHLTSEHPLQGVGISISDTPESSTDAIHMQPASESRQKWSAVITAPQTNQQDSTLRIALSANDSFYYAESGLAFIQYQTSYEKDFR